MCGGGREGLAVRIFVGYGVLRIRGNGRFSKSIRVACYCFLVLFYLPIHRKKIN